MDNRFALKTHVGSIRSHISRCEWLVSLKITLFCQIGIDRFDTVNIRIYTSTHTFRAIPACSAFVGRMEIPCSESTVYRALRRVQNYISSQNYDRYLQVLRKAIDQDPPNFGDNNAASALELLYVTNAEYNEHETAECNAGFFALDTILSDLPVAISSSIFDSVCALCSCHERNGFTEGFKLGVHIANELSTLEKHSLPKR